MTHFYSMLKTLYVAMAISKVVYQVELRDRCKPTKSQLSQSTNKESTDQRCLQEAQDHSG